MNLLKYKIFTLMLAVTLTALPVGAQYKIARSTFGNGGGILQNSSYRLQATVGQALVGATANTKFTSQAGFWYQKPIDIPTRVEEGDSAIIPAYYELEQNYPNPFNPSTNISFSLPKAGAVSLRIYNMLGQEVVKLVDKNMTAGIHHVMFDASILSSGIYLYRLQSGEFTKVRRLTLVK